MSESLHSQQILKIMQAKAQQHHTHCYHIYHGPILMIVPDGHVVQKCCKCNCMQTKHADHLWQGKGNGCVSVDISW